MRTHTPKYGNLTIYLVALAVVIGLMIALRHCDDKHTIGSQRIGGSQGDTIDVAIMYAPMSYYLYDDTIGGFSYDMLRFIAQRHNLNMRFYPIIDLNEALYKLEKGDFDILASLPIDNKQKEIFAYTDYIYLDRQMLVQLRDNDGLQSVNSALDLAGDTLHIEADSPIEFRIRNLSREIGDTIHIVPHRDLSGEYLFLKVASGDIRYAVVNEKIAIPLQKKYPNVSIDTPISFTQFQAWLVNKKDSTLLRNLNIWIDSLKNSPEYTSTLSRYN